MKPRGTALAIAITCVFLVAAVGALLVRSGTARVQARRADAQREEALRRAESALALARVALESGRLQPGGQLAWGDLVIQCKGLKDGVLLSTEVEMPVAAGVTPASLRRFLHVHWTMQLADQIWRRSAWCVDSETRSVQSSAPQAATK